MNAEKTLQKIKNHLLKRQLLKKAIRHIPRANNIRNRLLLAVSLLILISATSLSVLNYLHFASSYTEQSAENMQELVEQVAVNIENSLNEIGQLCLSPYYNSDIMRWLESDAVSAQNALEKRREIERYLQQSLITPRKDVMRVYILADSVYSSAKTGRSGITVNYKEESWYYNTLSTDDCVFRPVVFEETSPSSRVVFSVARQIYSLKDSSRTLGVILIDANYNGIKEICDRISVNPNGALMVVDQNGNAVYMRSKLSDEFSVSEILNAAKDGTYCIHTFENTDYIVNANAIPTVGWTVIAVNAKAEITKEAQETLLFNMVFAVIMAMIGMVISAFFINRYLQPLYATIKLMESVESGDLSVRAGQAYTEEIAYLNGTFNRMLSRIQKMLIQENQLTREVYTAKYLQKEAQYEALQRQIQPHFLFNTLSTISILAKCNRTTEVIESIDQLATLLRGMVNAGKEISLASELKIAESYLQLQQLRHDTLRYDIQTQGVDLGYYLPALTIQPIVENAITHGCCIHPQGTFIQIDMWYEENQLILSIHDNGAGMDPQILLHLQERLNDVDKQIETGGESGIGLVNIQSRIQHRFGQDYGIHVYSEIGKGTTVTLCLPRSNINVSCTHS